MEYQVRILERFLRRGKTLEIGPADGIATQRLLEMGLQMTVVEGSGHFVQALRAKFPQLEIIHTLCENFEPSERFDNIIMGHVLKHLVEPTLVLKRAQSWLATGGRIFASVPNAWSIHRQAAVIMGFLKHEHELNERDKAIGHQCVFDPVSLRRVFIECGYRIVTFGGFWLKPLSSSQIERWWTPEMLDAFMQLGERYPEIAAEIYVVAEVLDSAH